MLTLIGWHLSLGNSEIVEDAKKRIHVMRQGHDMLVNDTGTDFGYDLVRWREFLLEHEEYGYTFPYAFDVVDEEVRRAISDPEFQQFALAAAALEPPADAAAPEFGLREKVEVVLNHRNKTPRTGWVRDRIWHFKRQEWMFFLESRKEGAVSKRYFAEDLRSLRRAGKTQTSDRKLPPNPSGGDSHQK